MVAESDEKRMIDGEQLLGRVLTCVAEIPELERPREGAANHCYLMATTGINEIAKKYPTAGL